MNKRLDYFWREFAVPMLRNCGAKILFIVGANSTRDVFNRALQVINGELFSLPRNKYGEEFRIAAVNYSACRGWSFLILRGCAPLVRAEVVLPNDTCPCHLSPKALISYVP